jgi:cellulose synthase/poly-beta-1,6-N-acetylglucosamine synthase-like glycosyltransferase
LEIVAILLMVLLVMVLIGYPLALLCAGAVAAAPTRATGPMPETLSILLTTHDAAAHVGETLETMIAAVAAWPGHAEILVGDGSTDDTATIAERFAHRGVTVVRGATLARLAPIARGEILVMSDANTLFDLGTLPALLAPFADPMTGAVAGAVEALRRGRGRLAYAETLSRRWQIATRTAEDRLFGCTLADRGLYAIRCTLMPRLRPTSRKRSSFPRPL